MKFLFDDSPIIACSTSMASHGAIGIIRISGFKSLLDFQSSFDFPLGKVKERFATFTTLREDSIVLDEVVMTFFAGPKSYNGENILEISAHGNRLNLERILEHFMNRYPLRLAQAGEFTYRALKNKKLSLSQVEGLDLLLNANNPHVLEQGKNVLFGELHHTYLQLYENFKNLKTSVELFIDFLEDVGEKLAWEFFQKNLLAVDLVLENLYRRSLVPIGGLFSPEVVLVGEPNAGKSSLFNFLLGSQRAITSSVPGTTRDFISEAIQIKGTAFKFIDTAGLRLYTEDFIEREGMGLGKKVLEQSFFHILVINPLELTDYSDQLLQQYRFDLIVVTHYGESDDWAKLAIHFEKCQLPILFASLKTFAWKLVTPGPIGPVKSGPIGPENIKGTIFNYIYEKYQHEIEKNPILFSRHRELIMQIYVSHKEFFLKYANKSEECLGDVAIMDHQLTEIKQLVSELIGVIPVEDILNNVFEHFCIGK